MSCKSLGTSTITGVLHLRIDMSVKKIHAHLHPKSIWGKAVEVTLGKTSRDSKLKNITGIQLFQPFPHTHIITKNKKKKYTTKKKKKNTTYYGGSDACMLFYHKKTCLQDYALHMTVAT